MSHLATLIGTAPRRTVYRAQVMNNVMHCPPLHQYCKLLSTKRPHCIQQAHRVPLKSTHRTQSMCNNKHGSSFHESVQSCLDSSLAACVKLTCCLVENQDFGILQNSSRDTALVPESESSRVECGPSSLRQANKSPRHKEAFKIRDLME